MKLDFVDLGIMPYICAVGIYNRATRLICEL